MSKITLKVKVDESMYKCITNKDYYKRTNDVQVYQERGEFVRAMQSAIPITESEDCINRQVVIELIEFFQMNPQHFDFVNLINDIKKIPLAEPKTDVLDKIKDEMDDIAFDLADIDCTRKSRMIVDMNDAFEIIDKYKIESGD